MNAFRWHSPTWRRRFWTAAAVLLFVVLASHPELRVLLFLLDMVGAELFIALLGFQFKSFIANALVPILLGCWRMLSAAVAAVNSATMSLSPLRFLRDFARYGVFRWVDYGPHVWHSIHKLLRSAGQGPGEGLKPGYGHG